MELSTISNGAPTFIAHTLKVKLAAVTEKLETASLIFAVPQKGMTVKQLSQLRSKLPPGTSAMVVKTNSWAGD